MAWLTGDMDRFEGAYLGEPEWYNMLAQHWSVATEKDFHFLNSIKGTSAETKSLIEKGLTLALHPAPLAANLYRQFGPSAETGRTVEPFIGALRAELDGARQNVRLIVTELKKRDDVRQKRA